MLSDVHDDRAGTDMAIRTANDLHDWQALASRAFAPLVCEAAALASFSASLEEVSRTDGFTATEVATGAMVVRHEPDLGDEQAHLIVLQLSDRGEFASPSGSFRLQPGDAALLDTASPYRITSAGRHRQLVLRLRRVADEPVQGHGVFLSGDSSLVQLLDRIASSSPLRADPTPEVRARVGQALQQVARAVIADAASHPPRPPDDDRSGRYERCLDLIRERVDDPDLTVESLARRAHLSTRSLHQLFARFGTTPGGAIREERMALATRMLSRPSADVTVAVVAAACGFRDARTFARAFRRGSAATPTEWRRRAAVVEQDQRKA